MDIKILIREDGFINATKLCNLNNKLFGHWFSNKNTKKIIQKLKDELKEEVIYVRKGGRKDDTLGSWIHPLLATHLAQWISTDFSIKVSKWIEEWKSIREKNKIEYENSLLNLILDEKDDREKQIQLKLQKELGGVIEVKTEFGFIDLLTETELIEIKIGNNWKCGLGQLCVYSEYYKFHKKRLHLFDIGYNEKINKICSQYNIIVSYE
jgi:hypothetical protein